MKIYLLPVSFLLLALCTFCRVALPDSMVINPVTLVGEWHATEHHPERGKIDTVFVINADATFSGSLSINSQPVWQYSGGVATGRQPDYMGIPQKQPCPAAGRQGRNRRNTVSDGYRPDLPVCSQGYGKYPAPGQVKTGSNLTGQPLRGSCNPT